MEKLIAFAGIHTNQFAWMIDGVTSHRSFASSSKEEDDDDDDDDDPEESDDDDDDGGGDESFRF